MDRELAPEKLDTTRAMLVDPASYQESDNSVEVVFSTGARVLKYDYRADSLYLEDLPLSGMDLTDLNSGAHVLRSHDAYDVDAVLGSVVPGSARVVDGEARARIALSREESDRELVNKIRTGIVRKWSYGYERIGPYAPSVDPDSGYEVRTWERHRPYELSAVAVPADARTNTRSMEVSPAGATDGGTKMDEVKDTVKEAPVDVKAIEAAARKAEADRQDGIRALACKVNLKDDDIRGFLRDSELTVEAAGLKMLELIANRHAEQPEIKPQVEVTRDEAETRMQGMVEALAYRAMPNGKPSDKAREYVGYRLVDFARECVEAGGQRTKGMAPGAILDAAIFGSRAYHATGDFPLLLANTALKNFMGGYSRESRNFEAIATRRMVPNFKTVSELNLSGASSLDVTPEGQEIKYGTLTEGGETWNLVSLTKGLSVTRQALINDDLGAFGDIPARLGAAVVRAELDRFWALLTANAVMADSVTLFHAATHKNYTSAGAAPSTTEINKGRLLFRKQTDLGGQALNLVPSHLIIPPEHETAVDQLLTLITANQTSNVVPQVVRSLTPIVEPRLSANSTTAWYMAAASWPSLVYGYLEGSEMPRVSTRESWNIQGVEMKVEHDFGCGVSDYRGLYKNSGTGA